MKIVQFNVGDKFNGLTIVDSNYEIRNYDN